MVSHQTLLSPWLPLPFPVVPWRCVVRETRLLPSPGRHRHPFPVDLVWPSGGRETDRHRQTWWCWVLLRCAPSWTKHCKRKIMFVFGRCQVISIEEPENMLGVLDRVSTQAGSNYAGTGFIVKKCHYWLCFSRQWNPTVSVYQTLLGPFWTARNCLCIYFSTHIVSLFLFVISFLGFASSHLDFVVPVFAPCWPKKTRPCKESRSRQPVA